MRRNFIIFGVTLGLTTILAFFFVFSPQTTNIETTKQEALDAEARVTKLQLELHRLQELQKNAPKLREQATVLDAAMPNDPQLAQFILQVQDASNASGIEWLSIAPTPPAPGVAPQASEVAITMSVKGGYFQVQDFLSRLENLSRAVKIGNVGLSPTTIAGGGSPELTVAMTMKMFVSNLPTAAAPPATAPAA